MDSRKRKIGEPPPHVKRTKLTTQAPPNGPTKIKLLDGIVPRPDNRKRKNRARPPLRGGGGLYGEGTTGQQSNAQGGNRSQPSGDRLIRTIINGCLWHEDCKSLMPELPGEAPLCFSSANEYIRTYEPLLQEEGRESLKTSWVDACEAGNCWSVRVAKVEHMNGGGAKLEVELSKNLGGRRDSPNPNSIVVLSSFCPPKKNPAEQLQNALSGKPQRRGGLGKGAASGLGLGGGGVGDGVTGIVAGLVGQSNKEVPQRMFVEVFPECPGHTGCAEAPCQKVLMMLEDKQVQWYLVPTGSLVTHMREHGALMSVRKLTFLKALLRPDQELNEAVDRLPRKLPREVGMGLHEAMKKTYDGPQSDAIAMCTAHFATNPGTGKEGRKALPVMLIQGPPGTGKTHTVRGVLNLWHLVQFQRYYERVIGQYRPPSEAEAKSSGAGEWAGLMSLMKSGEMRTSMKPRILVCAPSNAATDELLERILKEGFFDASGKLYFPNVVRVGAEARVGADALPVSEGVRAVWVEEMVNFWLNMTGKEWERRIRECATKRRALGDEIAGLEGQMRQDPKAVDKLAGFLIANMEKREKNDIELERLEIVQPLLCGSHPGAMREAREKLELSYMDHAEMVFTTLSSTGKKVFSKVKRGFETVLIDEAAQACEVAALQPLVHGCNHCVLVGDPQQLPATMLSQKAKELNMERSLFERLQCAGAPVKVLTIQYRMHPQIRQFPSAYFYDNSLVDGQNILKDSFHEFYNHSLLKPYVLFDVASGQHERQNSGSLQNQVEAEMAVALFKELRDWLIKEAAKLRGEGKPPLRSVRVGVVTPYKSQRKCLKDAFTRVLGERIADEVKIATIDSFQGKQCDVVILSCVRACNRSSGVGFVADIRRMNVAITRAKRALWVLGNFRTLRHNAAWSALIVDAEKRGCIIKNAVARELFPHQPQFQSGAEGNGDGDKMDIDSETVIEKVNHGKQTQKDDRGHGKQHRRGGGGRGRGRGRGRGKVKQVQGNNRASTTEPMDIVRDVPEAVQSSNQVVKNAPQDPRKGVIAPADTNEMQTAFLGQICRLPDPRKAVVNVETSSGGGLCGEGTLMCPPVSDGTVGPSQHIGLIGLGTQVEAGRGGAAVGPHQLTISGLPKQTGDGSLDWISDTLQVASLHEAVRMAKKGDKNPTQIDGGGEQQTMFQNQPGSIQGSGLQLRGEFSGPMVRPHAGHRQEHDASVGHHKGSGEVSRRGGRGNHRGMGRGSFPSSKKRQGWSNRSRGGSRGGARTKGS